jgi:hypothetical protein
MLYLPLDKLTDRSRDTDSTPSGNLRPSVTLETDSSSAPDARQRVER